MTLAIFDLDNTLIAGDSDHLWGEFLCGQGLVDNAGFRAQNDRFYADYQRGDLDIEAYVRFVLAPLAGRRLDELAELHTAFMREAIEELMLPAAAALIQQHREQGHRLLIITATNEFITRPIGARFGIDELLGCAVEVRDGRLTGRTVGTLTYREGKVQRLGEWLQTENETLDGAWFYSDSHNDLPLLEQVANPVAVDPDEQLEAIARERGWSVMTLRDGSEPRLR
mgnify:FL=1